MFRYLYMLPVLAMVGTLGMFWAPEAVAQTAKKLNCKGCVKSKQVKNNGIKSKDIKDGQVRNQDLGSNSVDGGKIADDAVGPSEVASESIPATDLSNEAGGDFADGDQNVTLTSAQGEETFRSVAITPPTAGIVLVHAAGSFLRLANADAVVRCSISTNAALDFAHTIYESVSADAPRSNFGTTRGFEVTGGVSTTYNIVCDIFTGASIQIFDTSMTAIFLPTRY